jgi:hypothetical protein
MENAEIIFYPVPGYADLLMVNESGTHVKIKQRLKRTVWNNYIIIPEIIKTNIAVYDRYQSFTLKINGKAYRIAPHVLVCLAFHPNPENKPQVNHKDTNKLNNHKDNVEWSTHQENMDHAKMNKLFPTKEDWKKSHKNQCHGTKQHSSVLKPAHVLLIRSSPFTNKELSEHYGVVPSAIRKVRLRMTWKHI